MVYRAGFGTLLAVNCITTRQIQGSKGIDRHGLLMRARRLLSSKNDHTQLPGTHQQGPQSRAQVELAARRTPVGGQAGLATAAKSKSTAVCCRCVFSTATGISEDVSSSSLLPAFILAVKASNFDFDCRFSRNIANHCAVNISDGIASIMFCFKLSKLTVCRPQRLDVSQASGCP